MGEAGSSQEANKVHRSDRAKHWVKCVTINHFNVKECFAPTITHL